MLQCLIPWWHGAEPCRTRLFGEEVPPLLSLRDRHLAAEDYAGEILLIARPPSVAVDEVARAAWRSTTAAE
eukprot:369739-Pyramimonas_sp.AAC.1